LPSVACLSITFFFANALSPRRERRRAVATETDMLENGSGLVRTVAWSFDGKLLASGGDGARIILWDAKKGERLRELKGHG
jgi:WD40 repeat protein